ncbi:AraC family transcriptional regulator [Chitinophaga lutea]|uniref:AraC family transcriptional regulator n=1 Tax=Chitinophaga lutea TaxID=2488634 RepID=A0A3N4PGU7_9BACT|nr:AraC family transcriptional regulator [Chitinophaga lutea]RPE07923.1 AraC family transcriptional regulator [Chitinophaga lutea]
MISEVLAYINNHLDSKITLEVLSNVTGYSPHHLHKKLSAELGTSLGKYIQHQRLHAAAYFLALTRMPLNDIKHHVGFEDNSAFSRAFRQLYRVSPLQYRKSKKHQQEFPLQTFKYISANGVTTRERKKAARVFPSRGDYFSERVYAIWNDAAAYIASVNKTPEDFEYYAILHECPHMTGNQECRYDAAIVPKGFELPAEPFLQTNVLEGNYIRFNFCSKVQDYHAVSTEINSWLAKEAGVQHRHGVSYFKFDTLPDPGNIDNLFIHWYLPIA